jgi:hypothetical protein
VPGLSAASLARGWHESGKSPGTKAIGTLEQEESQVAYETNGTNMKKAAALLLLGAATGLLATSCRTPRRSLRVAGEAATLKVSMSGLAASDEGKGEWIYELSGCVATMNGTLEEGNVVSFTAVGLKAALPGCQFKVRSLESIPGIAFASESEPNVLYWSRDLTLSQNAAGELTAAAGLQKLYTVVATGDSIFTLTVPVKFPAPETGSAITGELTCTPDLVNAGKFTRTGAEAGTFAFKTDVKIETPFVCTELHLGVDGIRRKYGAELKGAAGKFAATSGGEHTLDEVKVKLLVTPTDDGEGIDVSTTGKECTGGKVFDVEKRECVDAPTP